MTPDPEPLPLPLPMTGVERRSSGTALRIAIIAGIALALVLALACGAYLAVARSGGLLFGADRVAAAIAERAADEFPGFERIGIRSLDATAPVTGDPETRYYVTLRSTSHAGFRFVACYYAPTSRAATASAYTVSESFFGKGTDSGLVDEFEAMWVGRYPGTFCHYVRDLGVAEGQRRIYEVIYSDPDAHPSSGRTWFAFEQETGTWTEADSADAAGAPPVTAAPAATETPVADDQPPATSSSNLETAAIVAAILPDFRIVREVPMSSEIPTALVRDPRHPGLMYLVCLPIANSYRQDPAFDLLEGRGPRGRAFVRQWLARHPRSAISDIQFDPDREGNNDRLTIMFATTIPNKGEIDDWEWMDTIEYSPATGTWKWIASE